MNNESPVTFSVRIPADLAGALERIAKAERRSKANVIRVLLTEAIVSRKSK
jgi:predicted transcriptional regulator